MYEFVTKKEYTPIRIEIEKIIRKVQISLKKQDKDETFQFRLVGSGNRHLITRIINGNSGFDFDYNLILNEKDFKWKATIRKDFFKAFQEATKGTKFNKIENSTSVITIKYIKGDKIIAGCDFSIVRYPSNDKSCYQYAKYNKQWENYTWEIRDISKNCDEKLLELKEHDEYIWNDIKEEYLKLKNNDRQKKHSFILYHEAINNLYNRVIKRDG